MVTNEWKWVHKNLSILASSWILRWEWDHFPTIEELGFDLCCFQVSALLKLPEASISRSMFLGFRVPSLVGCWRARKYAERVDFLILFVNQILWKLYVLPSVEKSPGLRFSINLGFDYTVHLRTRIRLPDSRLLLCSSEDWACFVRILGHWVGEFRMTSRIGQRLLRRALQLVGTEPISSATSSSGLYSLERWISLLAE